MIKMSLERLFLEPGIERIMDVLWEYQDMDVTLSDISEETGVPYAKLVNIFSILEELNILKTLEPGEFYKINKEDEMVKRLLSFVEALNIRFCEIEAVNQREKKEISRSSYHR